MFKQFSRSELLLGREGMEKLADSCVAVFGVGGVGSYVVEALARSGVGHLVLVDKTLLLLLKKLNSSANFLTKLDTLKSSYKGAFLCINAIIDMLLNACSRSS